MLDSDISAAEAHHLLNLAEKALQGQELAELAELFLHNLADHHPGSRRE